MRAAAGDLARLGAALGAVAAQRVEQGDVDRDDDDRRGDEADPKQGVDLVGARRVGRQSAAILITQAAVADGRCARAAAACSYTRRPRCGGAPGHLRRCASRSGPERPARSRAAVAVPLLRRRLRIPAPVTVAACAAGPLALAVLYPRSRKRDVALYALQMWAFTMVHELPYDDPDRPPRRASGPATRSSPTARSASAGCPTPASSAASPGCRGSGRSTASSPGSTGSGSSSPTSRWSTSSPPPRALPARRPPARRRLRHRLRRLLRGADRAAVVGLRAGPDRRRGAADHGRGRRGDLARGLAEDVRGARRQPLGGDALAALRDLDDGGDLARRSGPRSRARSAGPTR